jgi:hypothetical protein
MMPKLVGSYEPVALSVDVLHERRVERFYFGSTGDSDQDRLSRLDRLYLQCTIGEDVTSNVWCKRMCSLEASRAAVVFADELHLSENILVRITETTIEHLAGAVVQIRILHVAVESVVVNPDAASCVSKRECLVRHLHLKWSST